VAQAVLHVGSITLHGTAAYMAILVALAVVLGLLSRN
jgi:hypothetical protein